jgi:dihydroxy-acid dehydratase
MLAAAQEGEVPFTIDDIDRLSRQAPNLCKVAPSIVDIHIEDVHRAGGVFGIMGELDRMGLIHRNTRTVHAATTGDAIDKWDIRRSNDGAVHELYKAAPGGVRTLAAFGSKARYTELDMDRVNGAIRDKAHAYNLDGGLAVLYGNIAEDGALIKTAGVHASMLDKTFAGPARVFHSMEATCMAILGKKINPGDVVVILYEGPKGGPGMQEMLYPTGYLKSMGLEKVCALVTDGRFSGGSTGLSVGHISPEAAEGGNIGLVEEGDIIEIDIPTRAIKLRVSDAILKQRRAAMEAKGDQAWQPVRNRQVTAALKAYGALTTSASRGAVRDLNQRSGKPMAPQPVKDRVRA